MKRDLEDPLIEPSSDWSFYQRFYGVVYWMLEASWMVSRSYVANCRRFVGVTCEPATLCKRHDVDDYCLLGDQVQ